MYVDGRYSSSKYGYGWRKVRIRREEKKEKEGIKRKIRRKR
jgi:hypothetical protein